MANPMEQMQIAVHDLQQQLKNQDRVRNARITLAEVEILRMRDKKASSTHKSGIMDVVFSWSHLEGLHLL